jgi:hypothetical protein
LASTLALACAAAQEARASAFLEPPGEGDIITASEFSGSTRAFDRDGKLIPIPAYDKFEIASYVEYGLTDRLTLIAQPFFETAHQNSTAVTTPGTDIGSRFGLAEFGPTVLSIQGVLHIPFDSGQLPQAEFDEDDVFAGDLRLLLGHAFEIGGAPGSSTCKAAIDGRRTMYLTSGMPTSLREYDRSRACSSCCKHLRRLQTAAPQSTRVTRYSGIL